MINAYADPASKPDFEQLVRQAMAQAFSGWDFSWLEGRWREAEPTWDYRRLVEERIGDAGAMLDMGTGGGEFLASLPERPATTYATEAYPPNIPVAHHRLAPLGVRVVPVQDESTLLPGSRQVLPFGNERFDLIINRHEYYYLPEVARILKPQGTFLTQQVGSRDCVQLNQYLEAPLDRDAVGWSLEEEKRAFEIAGLEVLRVEEQLLETVFYDIGAVVYYLKVIEWQIPDFSVEKYRERLAAMHRLIQRQGAFYAASHRYLIEARKSAAIGEGVEPDQEESF